MDTLAVRDVAWAVPCTCLGAQGGRDTGGDDSSSAIFVGKPGVFIHPDVAAADTRVTDAPEFPVRGAGRGFGAAFTFHGTLVGGALDIGANTRRVEREAALGVGDLLLVSIKDEDVAIVAAVGLARCLLEATTVHTLAGSRGVLGVAGPGPFTIRAARVTLAGEAVVGRKELHGGEDGAAGAGLLNADEVLDHLGP